MIIDNMNFEVNGITIFVGNTSDFIKDVDWKDMSGKFDANVYLYPETSKYFNKLSELSREIVKSHKENKKKAIIVTGSVYLLRAIECTADLFEVMEDMDVYEINDIKDSKREWLKLRGNKYGAENLMYSEYGISSYYERCSNGLDQLEDEIEKKYENL